MSLINFLSEQSGLSKWHVRWMNRAIFTSYWSKDPREKVGCVIIDDHRNVLSDGYNGFPHGIRDDDRLNDKALKNLLVVHAEANAVATAAANGHALRNGTCYVNRHPCTQCAALLIQAQIRQVIYYHPNMHESTHLDNFTLAGDMLKEAGIQVLRLTV